MTEHHGQHQHCFECWEWNQGELLIQDQALGRIANAVDPTGALGLEPPHVVSERACERIAQRDELLALLIEWNRSYALVGWEVDLKMRTRAAIEKAEKGAQA